MKYHKNNAELFADARRALLGHLSVAVWSLLLVTALSILLAEISLSFNFDNKYLGLAMNLTARFLTTLLASLFGIGLCSIFLRLIYRQPASVGNLLTGLFENTDTCITVRFYVTGGEYICMLPLQLLLYIIPSGSLTAYLPLAAVVGVICAVTYILWSLTFSMANFLLLDFPQLDAGNILRVSRSMMRGNKMRLFRLYLRVLPLHLLGLFSFGLANIWAGCCQYACVAAFYKDMMNSAKAGI